MASKRFNEIKRILQSETIKSGFTESSIGLTCHVRKSLGFVLASKRESLFQIPVYSKTKAINLQNKRSLL